LASASIDDLYKVWEGLGYYRRARHMHQAAQRIVVEFDGVFPSTYDEILALDGVGPYAAAAIGSFAFGLPYPVIDGNVYRVISRIYGIYEEIDGAEGKKKTHRIVDRIFDRTDPASFNQAIMDFGALQCKPRQPDCSSCPLHMECHARKKNVVGDLPKKKTKKPRKKRYFYYLIFRDGEQIWIRKRKSQDVWQNLYEFYLVEVAKPSSWSDILSELPAGSQLLSTSNTYQQLLTHQQIFATFAEIKIDVRELQNKVDGMMRINREKLKNFAFPKVIDCYLGDNSVTLNLAF